MDVLIGEAAYRKAAMGNQDDLFGVEPPVIAAWGMGVDSTAMIVEMIRLGERIDAVLVADTGDERDETYAFKPLFEAYLKERCNGLQVQTVSYKPKKFKNFPKYSSLSENCLTNATLPSIAFGFSSCSLKWKVAPQEEWTNLYEPAQRIWDAGGKVVKLIGYDAGARDSKRYAEQEGHVSPKYLYRTPLREWGWDRERCEQAIRNAGLPVPPKSSCFHCTASKPFEIRLLSKAKLARIVAMEARAEPRLRTTEGLWRKTVKGTKKGTEAKPGKMTDFIRAEGLLPGPVIDRIVETVPLSLVAFMDSVADTPIEERPGLRSWLDFFEASSELGLDEEGGRLYDAPRSERAHVAA